MLGLLGIHCCQFWENVEVRKVEVRKETVAPERKGDPILEGDRLKIPSSMTIVMPAWRIVELLDSEPLEMARKEREKVWQETQEAKIPRPEKKAVPRPESAERAPPESDANSNHREDFTSLLGAAAKKPAQED
jgi:hypothetical protein